MSGPKNTKKTRAKTAAVTRKDIERIDACLREILASLKALNEITSTLLRIAKQPMRLDLGLDDLKPSKVLAETIAKRKRG